VFVGAATGELVGLDAETGEKLWADDLDWVVESSPVVWDDPVAERQYMAVTHDAGNGGRVSVYATEPGLEPLDMPTPTPTATPTPTDTATEDSTDESPVPTDRTSSSSGPGFGFLAGLSGLGVAGAARKWLGDSGDESDES